jgi:RecB family endonuclease NucS
MPTPSIKSEKAEVSNMALDQEKVGEIDYQKLILEASSTNSTNPKLLQEQYELVNDEVEVREGSIMDILADAALSEHRHGKTVRLS